MFTRMYFDKIIRNENTMIMSIYMQDVEALWAFVYNNGPFRSYYIADEIRNIIVKTFDF